MKVAAQGLLHVFQHGEVKFGESPESNKKLSKRISNTSSANGPHPCLLPSFINIQATFSNGALHAQVSIQMRPQRGLVHSQMGWPIPKVLRRYGKKNLRRSYPSTLPICETHSSDLGRG